VVTPTAASRRVRPMGERAVLVEVATLADVVSLHAALAASRPPGVIDLVPAARTVLVQVDPEVLPPAAARDWIAGVTGHAVDASPASTVELDIRYDGADLTETAALLDVDVDELVRRHCGAVWTVAFTGFAPGFGYLVSDDWPFDVPRLATPRTRVPAGSVGLAAGFTGAYPRETPGGWRLVGTTEAPLFDPGSAVPALLAPGTRVRFRSASALASGTGTYSGQEPAPVAAGRPRRPSAVVQPELGHARVGGGRGFEVIEAGLLATVQDLGRPGRAALGVARSGAMDRTALRTGNRLVGNPEGRAGVEITMGGFRARAQMPLWFAVTGGWGPVRLDGRTVDPYTAHEWPAGSELHIDWATHGVRMMLTVRGGVDVDEVLGSRSTDVLAGLGPDRLVAGAWVPVGEDPAAPIPVAPPAAWGVPADDLEIRLVPGPRADWFTAAALAALFEAEWTVGEESDRVGMRLDGPGLPRRDDGELASEGMVVGAIQVPPSGRPTVLGADGPVTGGYPVIAVVADASWDALGQARPGTRVRFRHARPV